LIGSEAILATLFVDDLHFKFEICVT